MISLDVTNSKNITFTVQYSFNKQYCFFNQKTFFYPFQILPYTNFFSFNNKFYGQPDGLTIACTLSPSLADLFMDYFENRFILNKINNTKHY